MSEACKHEKCGAKIKFAEVTGTTNRTMCELTIYCSECRAPYKFVGVDRGYGTDKPHVSLDCTQLRVPLEPPDDDEIEVELEETGKGMN